MTNIKKIFLILSACTLMVITGCASLGVTTIPINKLKAKYADAETKMIQVDGINVYYKDEGQGATLILLHGVCASLHTWDGWTERLKGHYRIIRIDIPGFGLTGPAPDRSFYTVERSVMLMEKIVAQMKLEKFYLAGNSLGGYISWNYALKNPDKVEKLILIDPVGFRQPLPGIIAFASNPLVKPFARYITPRFLFDMAVDEVYGDKSKVTDKLKDRYFELAMREGNKGSYIDVFSEMRKKNNDKLSTGIKDIKTPTLVMWGTKDIWIPFRYFDSWKKELPKAKFIQYEGAGHTPMEEVPDETARDADLFLSGKLGVIQFKNKKYDLAIREVEKCIKLDPARANVYYNNMAFIYEEMWQKSLALEYLKKANSPEPGC